MSFYWDPFSGSFDIDSELLELLKRKVGSLIMCNDIWRSQVRVNSDKSYILPYVLGRDVLKLLLYLKSGLLINYV